MRVQEIMVIYMLYYIYKCVCVCVTHPAQPASPIRASSSNLPKDFSDLVL